MGQSRKWSLIEAATNVIVGYALALIGQFILYPIMGIPVTFRQNLVIGCVFLTIGLARAFALRRFFNHVHQNWMGKWMDRWKRL